MRKANLDQEFVAKIASAIGLEFLSEGGGNLTAEFGPEDVFHYIYAVLHSRNTAAASTPNFLKSDFPRIPLSDDLALFAALAGLGKRLASLHLMEAEGKDTPAFPCKGDNRISKIHYAPPTDVLRVGRGSTASSISRA